MNYHLKNAERIANLLDGKFNVLGIRFGFDPIIGLIPGLGDMLTVIVSFYLLYIGLQMKIPKRELRKMVFNIGLDYILGLIPLAGDVFDIAFKANERNYKILNKYRNA